MGSHSISGASTSIFANYGARDYHIVPTIGSLYPRDKGTALGTMYNLDFDGNLRGADGLWDVGAFEYGSTGSAITFTLNYSAGIGGTINGTSLQTVVSNAAGSAVTAMPNAGYGFSKWSDNSTVNPRTDANASSNLTVTANFVATIQGTNFYVRAGASGSNSGADWNNAWPDVASINWTSILPGSTIWIAGGNYGLLNIGASGTAGSPITILRVRSTNAVPVAAAGWNSAYDSQVTINMVQCFARNYLRLDGQIPYIGIMVTNTSATTGYNINFSSGYGTAGSSYITLANLNISGSVLRTTTLTVNTPTRCINWNYSTSGNDFVMSNCFLAYSPTLCSFVGAWGNATIVHNKFTQNNNGGSTGSQMHKNILQTIGGTNVVFAYNQIYNWANEGIMMDFNTSSDAPNVGWDIYNNLVYGDWEGVARFCEAQSTAQLGIRIYNNTFVDLGYYTVIAQPSGSWGAGCYTSNNIAIDCGYANAMLSGVVMGNGFDDYNLTDATTQPGVHSITGASSSIFTNYLGNDFHIVGTIGAKFPHSKGFSMNGLAANDLDGRPRGTNWDIGAYQYFSGGVTNLADTTPPTVSLTAPSANAVLSNTVTLSVTAIDNTGGSGVSNVAFLVDGVAVGSNSSAPYSITWNSKSLVNGSHTIQARAQDAAGNQASSSSMAVTVQNPVVTFLSGLIGYWPFEETSGTMAKDASGNGNNGALMGDATWGLGHIRNALSLSGLTGYVQVPSTPNLEQFSNAVTICGWAYFGTNSTYVAGTMQDVVRKVVSLTTNVSPYSAYDLVVQDFGGGTFKARMGVTRASDSTRGISNWGNAHTYGSWYYLAGVYDGSTVQVYVNGVQESSAAFVGTLLQTSQPLCIGRYGSVGEAMNGRIDDLRVYNRALSTAEIQILFNATAPAAPSSLIIQTN